MQFEKRQDSLYRKLARVNSQTNAEVVVLVHGLAGFRLTMSPLARRLESHGFTTVNWGYPSIRRSINWNAQDFDRLLHVLESHPNVNRFHLVTHSMGGIIARCALARNAKQKVGRIVMLATPNEGSPVAARLSRLLGMVCRPLPQLSHHPESFVNQLREPENLQIGIVAAGADILVPVQNTYLKNQLDHITVPTGHTRILFRQDVAQFVGRFLLSGSFSHRDAVSGTPVLCNTR